MGFIKKIFENDEEDAQTLTGTEDEYYKGDAKASDNSGNKMI